MNKNYCLKMTLHNLSKNENNNRVLTYRQRRYYGGLIVGAISVLMDNQGVNFEKALKILIQNLPTDCIDLSDNVLPESWIEPFKTIQEEI